MHSWTPISPHTPNGPPTANPDKWWPILSLIDDADPSRILVEEFDWETEKGRISELRLEATGAYITPAIDEGSHLSYPYTFRHEGITYAIPESEKAGGIFLYRLDDATREWSQEAVLVEGVSALDATLFEHDGRWWLMYSQTGGCGPWSLYLQHAPDLKGPWEPHIANPVKTDVRSSRPGGHLFFHEGFLYRPCQDNRAGYGAALCIARIDELSVMRFRETPVRRIYPDPKGPYPDGIHTLSGRGSFTVIDGKRHTWPLALLWRRQLTKRLGRKPRGFSYSNVQLMRPSPFAAASSQKDKSALNSTASQTRP